MRTDTETAPPRPGAEEYPADLLPSLRGLPLVCPLCRGKLAVLPGAFRCPPCGRDYPLHGGIPDFRVFPDPYLSYRDDHDRTEFVLDALERHDFPSLLDAYWSRSDVTPVALRGKFVRGALMGEHRASRTLRVLGDGTFGRPVRARRVLEVGSGTGNFLAAASGRFETLVGVDIAMRWLHVSRSRFRERGLPVPPLVCCCAESLPFPDGTFDLVVASSTLEFARDQRRLLDEAARVLGEDGSAYVNTVNRYSLGTNPYVYLWGVGFLPRRWQARYVRRRRDASFENIRLLSLPELDRLASRCFSRREYALPEVDEAAAREFPPALKLQLRGYRLLKRFPLSGPILRRFGPQWDVLLGGKRTPPDPDEDR